MQPDLPSGTRPGAPSSLPAQGAQPLTIEIDRLGGADGPATFLTRMSGAVTTPSVRLMEHQFGQLIAAAGSSPRILLDLSDMTLVDPAGLQVVLDLQRRIIAAGGEFELLNPSATVVTMLHEAGRDSAC